MPKFIVRVVLHGAKEDEEAYEDLHERMREKNYYRTIAGSDGTRYKLPPATYSASGDGWTVVKIRDEVKQIADTTGYKNSVLATEAVTSAWVGLNRE